MVKQICILFVCHELKSRILRYSHKMILTALIYGYNIPILVNCINK